MLPRKRRKRRLISPPFSIPMLAGQQSAKSKTNIQVSAGEDETPTSSLKMRETGAPRPQPPPLRRRKFHSITPPRCGGIHFVPFPPPPIKRGLRSPLEHSPWRRGTKDERYPAGDEGRKTRESGEDKASTSSLKMRETDARRLHPPPQSSTEPPSRADI